MKQLQPIEEDDELAKLMPAFGDDLDLFLFYLSWLKNDLNATVAYKELHPNVKDNSAATLGGQWLRRIDKIELMRAYGLDHQKYYKQLKAGLEATKRDQFSGEVEDDHKTRLPYHDKLGKALGIEHDNNSLINAPGSKILVIPSELIEKYGITSDTKGSS